MKSCQPTCTQVVVCMLLGSFAFALAGPGLAADAPKVQAPGKVGDAVVLRQEQLHQIVVATVETKPFLVMKPGLGQIAFNEDRSSVVLAPFSGRITKLYAKVGDTVKRGDPLFELDSSEVVQAQTDLIAAVQGVGKVNSSLALARRALDRHANLLAASATSQREFDAAKNDYAAAEADVKTADGALRAARNRLRVMTGWADDEIARIERERAVSPTISVNAPLDGTIVSRKIGPGQYVRSDLAEPLFSIADLSTMWLKAAVPENDIPLIKVGQLIEVKVAALGDRVFRASVSHIGAASDPTTRRVIVRAELPNPDRGLRAEMFATFRIRISHEQNSVGVPPEAIVWDGDKSVVWVQTGPLVFQRREVTTAREQSGYVMVTSGLSAGEKVAARGAIFIDNEWHH